MSLDELDALSTEELRRRAFERAEHRHDIGFFWDLIKHLQPSSDLSADDGSAGGLTGGIAEAVELLRELTGRGIEHGDEPMLRARFISYLS